MQTTEWRPQQLEDLASQFREMGEAANLEVNQQPDAVRVDAKIGGLGWTVRWDEPVCTWTRGTEEYRFVLVLFHTTFRMAGDRITLEVRLRNPAADCASLFMHELLHAFSMSKGQYKLTGIQEVFLQRSAKALLQLGELSEPALKAAITASSDPGVLVSALQSEEALAAVGTNDPLMQARLRGITAKQKLLESHGGTLTAEETANLLKMTRQGVDLKRKKGQLLALELGKRGYGYPVWQFGASGILPGLESALQALAGHDSWMQLAFFVGSNPRLRGKAPLEALGEGKLAEVLQAAQAYGEQGAS